MLFTLLAEQRLSRELLLVKLVKMPDVDNSIQNTTYAEL